VDWSYCWRDDSVPECTTMRLAKEATSLVYPAAILAIMVPWTVMYVISRGALKASGIDGMIGSNVNRLGIT
jgi:hypothetical protein